MHSGRISSLAGPHAPESLNIGPLTSPPVPAITIAVNFAYIKGGQPFFTFRSSITDHSWSGVSDLFR